MKLSLEATELPPGSGRGNLMGMKCATWRALVCLALSVAGCQRSESNSRNSDSNASASIPNLAEERSAVQATPQCYVGMNQGLASPVPLSVTRLKCASLLARERTLGL